MADSAEMVNGRRKIVGLPPGAALEWYSKEVGLGTDQLLADAAREFLPRETGFAMNRNLVREVQSGEKTLGNGIGPVQMMALAKACGVPAEWLGVDMNADVLRQLKDLLTWVPAANGDGDGERQPRSKRTRAQEDRRRPDQDRRDSRWFPEVAAQSLEAHGA